MLLLPIFSPQAKWLQWLILMRQGQGAGLKQVHPAA